MAMRKGGHFFMDNFLFFWAGHWYFNLTSVASHTFTLVLN